MLCLPVSADPLTLKIEVVKENKDKLVVVAQSVAVASVALVPVASESELEWVPGAF